MSHKSSQTCRLVLIVLLLCAAFVSVSGRLYALSTKETRLVKLEPASLEEKLTLYLPNGTQLRYRAEFEFEVVMAILKVESHYEHAWTAIARAPSTTLGKTRIAFVREENGKNCVVLDGVAGKQYQSIAPYHLLFSPDGRRFAYVASTGKQQVVVVDGKEWPGMEFVECLAFSPDSRHAVCVGRTANQTLVLFDGRIARLSDSIPHLLRLPKSKWYIFQPNIPNTLGLSINRDYLNLVVVDSPEGLRYTRIYTGVSSPDGKRLAYTYYRGQTKLLVLDGKERKLEASDLLFSPDSKRFAYTMPGLHGKDRTLVVDGRKVGTHEQIGGVAFSPDSKHLAYIGVNKDMISVSVDGRKRGVYSAANDAYIEALRWNPNSRNLVWVLNTRKFYKLFVDGSELMTADIVSTPVFSPDGKHMAFSALVGLTAMVVLDGKIYDSRQYTDGVLLVPTDLIAFSPDGKRIAYFSDGQVTIDKQKSSVYDFAMYWSDMDKEWHYRIDGRTVILNSVGAEAHQSRVASYPDSAQSRRIFDSPTSLSYFAVKGDFICLVEHSL